MAVQTNNTTGWVGWIYFAGILMLVRSFFQAFLGIVALSKDDFFLVSQDKLAVFNFTAWGWVHLVLAAIMLTAAFSVFGGGVWGRVVGIFVYSMSLLINLIFLPAYPIWSIAIILMDSLIIYALVVHGDEVRE
jgi:hypothetical protein